MRRVRSVVRQKDRVKEFMHEISINRGEGLNR